MFLKVSVEFIRCFLRIEIVARTLRKLLVSSWRALLRRGYSTSLSRNKTIEFLNLTFGTSARSLSFWRDLAALASSKFRGYNETGLDAQKSVSKFALLVRLTSLLGISLKSDKLESLCQSPELFSRDNPFLDEDLLRFDKTFIIMC